MGTIDEKRRWRQQVLELLYEETTADGMRELQPAAIKDRVGLSDFDFDQVRHHLTERDLARSDTMAGELYITERGIDEVEERLSPTSSQVLSVVELRTVEAFLTQLARVIDEGDVPGDEEDRAVVEAEAATIAAAIRSPRPNRGVVAAALGNIGRLLHGAAGGVIGNAAFELLKRLS